MKWPEFQLNSELIKSIGSLLNSRIGLALLILFTFQPIMNDINLKLESIKTIAEVVKFEHEKTPQLLSSIREKIIQFCGKCENANYKH